MPWERNLANQGVAGMCESIEVFGEEPSVSDAALEARARRAARRIGLVAFKSRSRRGSSDNHGGFTIIDPNRNAIVAGERCDLSAKDVLDFCARRG